MTTLNLKQIVIDYRMNYKTQMLIKATLCNYCVNLTHSHMKLCVYRKILCVTWRTVFLFCAFWPKFCASNTLWHRLTETLADSIINLQPTSNYRFMYWAEFHSWRKPQIDLFLFTLLQWTCTIDSFIYLWWTFSLPMTNNYRTVELTPAKRCVLSKLGLQTIWGAFPLIFFSTTATLISRNKFIWLVILV